ncbi:hypothetical protein [Nesterenkonia ebinurensis]|uniref:hypothetical protein n=1 Tax=Nesterenkonia ebinurensis TaxID=2608252 RepID=UPI00123D6AFF|nr:hypothetical protein [Nesterenkonia ebinurensis]
MNHFEGALAVLAGAGLLPLSAVPAEEGDYTAELTVPESATSLWVDLESAEAAAEVVTGSLDGAELDFRDTILGVTAVTEVSPGDAVLELEVAQDLETELYIAFTDEASNILSSQTSSEVLSAAPQEGETPSPTQSPSPSDSPTPTTSPTPTESGTPTAVGTTSESPSDEPEDEAEDEGGLAATGTVIAWAVAGAALLLLGGAGLAYAGRTRKGGAL